MSALDDLAQWASEEDEPKVREFKGIFGDEVAKAFKARGHGTWAWKKGMRADRGAKSVVDYRDEKHVWLAPRSAKRRRVSKATMVDEALKEMKIKGSVTTLQDKR